jgi:hypothetical protein
MIRGNHHHLEVREFLQQVADNSRFLEPIRCPEKDNLRAQADLSNKEI